MPGLIRRSDIDEVRARINLADVVGDYVTLKNAGVGSLKGLCPFHEERSPSFHVRPQVGFYHCFGCGEGGDVFTFLQKMDHVTFQEAVERMAGAHRLRAALRRRRAGERPRQPGAAAGGERRRRDVLPRAAGDTGCADRPRLPRSARVRPGRRRPVRHRLRAEVVQRARRRPQGAGLHRARADDRRAAEHGRPRQQLRPVPGPADLADPRHHGPDGRVRRAQAARRRAGQGAEVPQHPRDADLPQEPGALRARPRATRHREEQAGRGGRGLHGCDGLPPRGRHHRGRDLRHELRRRPHQGHPARARRRRQRRHLGPRRGRLHLRPG